MGTMHKTSTWTDQQDSWIKSQIEAGHDPDDSDGIHDLIRREQERSAEIDAIRNALVEGEASGAPKPFDVDAFKRRMRAAHG